ncbi:Lrp/AsnC family transcriptional regulator [Novosphingobium piscinae]|uniref:Lrp/AsnC family transcriptional regulator n=1 Tax=Novosphingobium piscinae TaxID=1507448 RepID=A0A7X1KQH2_9SPHN|nr:Lrp/AsnC family transcriptional regulator [Novosphingobium piscinae]MBC2669749.1 Lrp/AsnC family transcriptional regulator [Novosphingobium piscinae]
MELDEVDFRLLELLSTDGRCTDVAMGEQLGLSSPAVARRRRILEENGIIAGYRAQLSLEQLGFSGVVIVMIELRSQAEQVLNEFEEEVVKCPSMSYCGFISGDTDFILIVHVSSLDEYDTIYRRELSNLPHVAKIRSSFILREVARRSTIPIVFDRARTGRGHPPR